VTCANLKHILYTTFVSNRFVCFKFQKINSQSTVFFYPKSLFILHNSSRVGKPKFVEVTVCFINRWSHSTTTGDNNYYASNASNSALSYFIQIEDWGLDQVGTISTDHIIYLLGDVVGICIRWAIIGYRMFRSSVVNHSLRWIPH